jgi:TP901 family phage tail tape measure protein
MVLRTSAIRTTAVALGTCTALTADQAATTLGHLVRMLGVNDADISRLGSTLVDLSQNVAASESEILRIAQRIGPTAAVVGLEARHVLAISAVLAAQASDTAGANVLVEALRRSENAWSTGTALDDAVRRWSD